MKRSIGAVVVAGMLMASASEPAFPAEAGRFQLVEADYDQFDLRGTVQKFNGLFRIDTATGAIEICQMRQWYEGDPRDKNAVMALVCHPIEKPIALDRSLVP